MPIENRNLSPGTRLVATYKKQHHACIVSDAGDGKTAFTLEDGRSFTSPSAAGSAVMGGLACNGWRFWSVEGAMVPAPTEKPTSEPKPGRAKQNGEHRAIKRTPNQKGASEGMTKYFCDSCMKGFECPTDAGAPEACPEGHPAVLRDEPPVA